MTFRAVRRLTLVLLALPFCYFGTASATFLFRLHAENVAETRTPGRLFPSLDSSRRILIVSPHPDDEMLGCAGVIQQAVQAGVPVQVVFLTNGDGFRVAAERQFRELQIQPSDYIHFAAIRQDESRRALRGLGLPASGLLFLGYPDRGLLPMWQDHWTRDAAYLSPYTQASACPYPVARNPHAAYCGQSLLDDLEGVLRQAQPTDVFVTHPSDDHPDHCAAAAFASLALQQLDDAHEPWAARCRLHYYLVHRGDWPLPQGLYRGDPLAPPAEMAALDTDWSRLPLTAAQVSRKARGIQAYRSQTAVMKRFLVSFARSNELFGEIGEATVPRVDDGLMRPDGADEDWRGISPVVLDPVNDSLLRDFQRGADIRAIYACHDSTNLYVRIAAYRRISERVQFTLRIRYLGDPARSEAGGTFTAVICPPSSVAPAELVTGVQDGCLEIAIPLRSLAYSPRFALNVESRLAGFQVDRTGYRFVRVGW